jgi:hypothetical protein
VPAKLRSEAVLVAPIVAYLRHRRPLSSVWLTHRMKPRRKSWRSNNSPFGQKIKSA